MSGLRSFAGRTALVTGAASGIGRELARGLFLEGAHLALVDLNGEGLAALRAELADAPNRRVSVHVADVADRARMAALRDEVATAHPALHLLVNNAGVAYEAAFAQTSLETWDHVVGVNLWGVVHGLHFFLPMLAKADRAHVVNLSSLLGLTGMAGQTAYCTTKYAVRGLSESLWEELRGTTVGLTVVHPGSVATDIMRVADGDDPELLDHLADWYDRHAYAPERAAAEILRAVRTGRRRLLIAPEATLVDVVKRLSPVLGNRVVCDLIVRALGVGHMREERRRQWDETMAGGGS